MPDVLQRESGVEVSEVGMGEIFKDEAGGFEVLTFDDVPEGHNIGMIELGEDLIFPSDFVFADGHEHFDGDRLVVALVSALENVRVLASTQFSMHYIVIHIAGLCGKYPHLT